MYCPLDLTVRQQHIYTLLYNRSEFKDNYKVAYTIEQLTLDSDKCFELTEKMVRTIIKQLIEKSYLIEVSKGKKGFPTVYEICVNNIISGNQSVTNRSLIGNQLVTNNEPISNVVEFTGNQLVTNRSLIGNQKVNPIIKEKDKDKKNIYIVEVIEYLNQKTGKSFKPSTNKTISCLNARWNEGYTNLDEYKAVIDIKCEKWLHDEKMVDFLRPETLFGTKFESYLNESKLKEPKRKLTPEEINEMLQKGVKF